MSLPREVEVIVEVPRGGLLKRDASGALDAVSPIPCPYNYGSVPGTRAADGEPVDAIVIGPRLARGTRVLLPVQAVARFVDGGHDDPKLVCKRTPLVRSDEIGLIIFFRLYATLKRAWHLVRGRSGPTRFEGLDRRDPTNSAG